MFFPIVVDCDSLWSLKGRQANIIGGNASSSLELVIQYNQFRRAVAIQIGKRHIVYKHNLVLSWMNIIF